MRLSPNMDFYSDHSFLETDHQKFEQYLAMVQRALGANRSIVGVIEIGSYAKGEAVPESDADTRIYATAPDAYLRLTMGRIHQSQSRMEVMDQAYARLEKEQGSLPVESRTWEDFSQPLSEALLREFGRPIDVGYTDARLVDLLLRDPGLGALPDFDLLQQSNVLYDPQGVLAGWKERLRGRKPPEIETFYRSRYLDALPFEIYGNLGADHADVYKLTHGGQIQWVKWAVRSLRDAVATKTWMQTGTFVYRKDDVLRWYQEHLPARFPFVRQIYRLKIDPLERKQLAERFLANAQECFAQFRSYMPELEQTVKEVGETESLPRI